MNESRKWRPDRWTKRTIRRCLSRARRRIYGLILAAESPEDAFGLGEAIQEITIAEIGLEATIESSGISASLDRIGRRLRDGSEAVERQHVN